MIIMIFIYSPNYVKQLWITIFNNQDLVEFSYQNYMMNRGIVYHNHGEQTLASDVKFVCQFPFFWLIKGSIDSKLGLVKSSFGKFQKLFILIVKYFIT